MNQPAALSTSDRAMLRAFRAWGGPDFDRASRHFSPGWRERVCAAWPTERRKSSRDAWDHLRRDHEASIRFDPSRVHWTWFVRALKSESPAVKRVVTARVDPTLSQILRRELKLTEDDLSPDRPADPEALEAALSLWAERLIGDVEMVEDDPPVVVAITQLGPIGLARLVKVCGLVKHAFAIEGTGPSARDEEIAHFTPMARVRLGFFRRNIGSADPRLVPLARRDLGVIEGDRRRAHARVGLLTLGRLLAAVEPHRSRWASQHLPYPVVQMLRNAETSAAPQKSLLAWEAWVLEAAWTRLLGEDRLSGDGREHSIGACP